MAERRYARPLLLRTALGGILLAAIVGAFVLVDGLARRAARAEAAAALENAVDIFASGLQSELDKFRLVPLVLAEDPEARRLLRDPAHPAQDMNRRLEALARRTDASAIYLMNANGDTVAASNWQQADSFVGANYAFRRYFHDALIRGDAAQFALGTRSRHPGLYIARRVGAAENALGVVVVKVEFDALERLWRQADEPVFVADRRGVVLITSRPDWRFHTITPEAGGRVARARNLTQFGREHLPLLDAYAEDAAPARATIDAERPVSLGWTLHMLADADDALRAASGRARLLLAAALLATAALAGLFHQIRRARLARADAATRARIDELREQLVQANRLAVLGQIAASVGHEINQPVAAAQVYAESGAKLLGAGRLDDARRNFGHIADLTLRIGEITGELRRFARKGRRELRQVRVGDAIESALRLLDERIRRSATIVVREPARENERVWAEHVRLEQVLVNLLRNALDACGDGGRIEISVRPNSETVRITVSDDGPGLDADIRARLFQPFSTSKQDGLGLGLVISQDIMKDLGGDLVAEPADTGAAFTLSLRSAA